MQKKPSASFVAGLAFALVLVGASKTLHADPPPSFAAGETLSAQKLNGALTSLSARLDALEGKAPAPGAVAPPPGTIVAFAGATIPAGWKLCDGSTVNRADNAALFGAIGTAWGNGDGTTTFNLPDLRGRFLRGVDRNANRDPDRGTRTGEMPGQNTGDNVGSLQGEGVRNHTHSYVQITAAQVQVQGASSPIAVISAVTAGQTGGVVGPDNSETRPKNANVNYIIKE
jgi:microcystin-dependent protein